MKKTRHLGKFAGRISPLTLLGIFFLLYLLFYILAGQRGLVAFVRSSNTVAQMASIDKTLARREKDLTEKVSMLNDRNPDLDFVQELVRIKLGLLPKRSVLIVTSKES